MQCDNTSSSSPICIVIVWFRQMCKIKISVEKERPSDRESKRDVCQANVIIGVRSTSSHITFIAQPIPAQQNISTTNFIVLLCKLLLFITITLLNRNEIRYFFSSRLFWISFLARGVWVCVYSNGFEFADWMNALCIQSRREQKKKKNQLPHTIGLIDVGERAYNTP